MVRSPFAHATDHRHRHRRGQGGPGRRRGLHRQGPRGHPGRQHQRLADHAPTRSPPPTCPSPSTTSPAPARSSPSSWPAPQPPARDAAELVDVDYDELPAVLDLKEAATDDRARPPRPRHEQVGLLEARLGGGAAPAATSTRPSPRRATDGIVIEREYRQQRLVPAFMEPRSTVVDPTGEQMTVWSATQVPHILRFAHRRDHGHPGVQGARHRPRRRWWLRRQAADHARGVRDDRRRPPARQAVQVHRDPLGVDDLGAPRPRPVAEAHPRRPRRTARSPASRSSCSPTWAPTSRIVGGGVPVLGAWMFNSIYKFPAYQFNCQTVLTNKTWVDAYRGAGRPEATYAHRADHGRARRRGRRRPARDPREELDHARGVPLHHGRRA